jgi:Fe2+ or Zn2+ uptake regulation protein
VSRPGKARRTESAAQHTTAIIVRREGGLLRIQDRGAEAQLRKKVREAGVQLRKNRKRIAGDCDDRLSGTWLASLL